MKKKHLNSNETKRIEVRKRQITDNKVEISKKHLKIEKQKPKVCRMCSSNRKDNRLQKIFKIFN